MAATGTEISLATTATAAAAAGDVPATAEVAAAAADISAATPGPNAVFDGGSCST